MAISVLLVCSTLEHQTNLVATPTIFGYILFIFASIVSTATRRNFIYKKGLYLTKITVRPTCLHLNIPKKQKQEEKVKRSTITKNTGHWHNGLECSPMARETWVQSQVESYQRLKKMVLDATLLNIQHYKVRIKCKVGQSRERSSALPLHLGVVAIEKGAFWSPSTTVANFTYFTNKEETNTCTKS